MSATVNSVGNRIRTQSEGISGWDRSSFHADDEVIGVRESIDEKKSANSRLSLQVPTKSSIAKSVWSKIGQISDRASEVLEDARLTYHGKEKRLYDSSAQRLSSTQDPALKQLGDRVSIEGGSRQSIAEETAEIVAEIEAEKQQEHAPDIVEPVKWEGVLSKRTEWLRRWEKQYYVVEGTVLKRFPSKEAYLGSLDRSPSESRPRRSSVTTPHVYHVSGVKDSSVRPFAFSISTIEGKTLILSASSPIEKLVWMRLVLESLEAVPGSEFVPLDVEEFYAMMVVLYTGHSGHWSSSGDMAVTLPPPAEQVFTRFFAFLDPGVILTSNYPPSVPFCGSFREHSGVLQYMSAFASNTKWTKFKIQGMTMEGNIAVACGFEELENVNDSRRFIQNWVHKFTFGINGRVSRIEINGDVVAASAVFKIPGAATTLKLPQDLQEVNSEEGKSGVLQVCVLQAHGLKFGSQKKVPREPSAILSIEHGDAASASSNSTQSISGISVHGLSYKFGSSLKSSDSPSSNLEVLSTGPPRNLGSSECSDPVWEAMISLPFEDVRGTCWLQLHVFDKSKGSDSKLGKASINVSPFISASNTKSETHWHTISNAKGEYCGKVSLSISCVIGDDRSRTDSSASSQKVSQMLQWKHDSTSSEDQIDRPRAVSSAVKDDKGSRLRGWSSVTLSPGVLRKPRSAESILDEGKEKNDDQGSGRDSTDGVILSEQVHTFSVCGAPFVVPVHYNLIKVCGRGAYGIVIAATNTKTRGNVAIKKVIDCIWHPHQLKQVLREVRLMRHLAHENILNLMDLLPPPSYTDFRDLYMVVDLMEMDLHRIIYSKEVLSDDHIRYFLYQILSGLNHMHAAGVLHRDLKPSNLLINSDCLLKICDFGLARPKDLEDAGMTEYVVTRWYRAPELLLGSAYDEAVDLWAAGCIFAEMLGRKPLFPGRSYVHQLQLIMNVLGVPHEHSFKENPMAQKLKGRQLLSRTPSMQGIDVSSLFTNANPEALDLLWKILVFDPKKRISVSEALRHPYLAAWFDEEKDHREVEKFSNFDFNDIPEADLKELMFREICHFHPDQMEKRAQQLKDMPEEEKLPPGWIKRESRSIPGKFYYTNPKRGLSTWSKPSA